MVNPERNNGLRPWTVSPWVLGFAMGLPAVITYLYFVHLREQATGWQQLAYLVGKTVQFSLPILLWGIARRNIQSADREKLSSVHHVHWCLVGLASGIVMAAAIVLAYAVLIRNSSHADNLALQLQAKLQGLGLTTPTRYLLMSLFYCVVHSWLEEYYWRWFIFAQSARRMAFPIAIVVASLAFAAHHVLVLGLLLGWTSWITVACSIGVAFGGGFWAWLYDRSGSLIPGWLSHFVVDAAIMGLGYHVAQAVY